MTQEGDVLLYQSVDGGEIEYSNGLALMIPGLETFVYLCLFGGNEDDAGGDDRTLQWWGNIDEVDKTRQHRSKTQYIIESLPANTANLQRLERATKDDLKVMLDIGLASSIEVQINLPMLNTVEIKLNIDGNTELIFTEVWSYSV